MIDEKKGSKYIQGYLKKNYRKKSRQLKASSVAATIISTFAREIGSLGDIVKDFSDSDWTIFPRIGWHTEAYKRRYSESQLTGGLSSLERGGYIKREGKRTVFLTERGIQEILKYKMKNKHLEKPWDGKWRIIVFDIAEATRKDRNYLRSQLKWIGFQELQKSVWVFPYEVRDELKEFIKMCKFEFQGDVRFILADNIDPDLLLRRGFNL